MTTPISETVCHLLGHAMFNPHTKLEVFTTATKISKATQNVEIVVVWCCYGSLKVIGVCANEIRYLGIYCPI